MRLNRRQILQASLFGGLVGTFGGLAPAEGPVATAARAAGKAAGRAGTLDSYAMLRNAVRLGQRIQLGSTARADVTPNEDAVIVTIKVMNHIHTPLCFKLGGMSEDGEALPYTGPAMISWEKKFKDPAALALLMGRGLDEPSDIERFRRLRLNRWFASILDTGTIETDAIPGVLTAADVGPFPSEDEVAFQCALNVNQTDLSLNHSFKNVVLPVTTDTERGGDINYHCAKQGIIKSPLGMVCLNMGGVVETTDSIGNVPNRIVTNDQVTVAALGRSVDSYVKVLNQAVGLGLIDEALLSKFDTFVKGDTSIADELKKNRTSLADALAAMGTASALEKAKNTMTGLAAANFQLIGTKSDDVAQTEFLAQCKFVQQALEIQGKPFRNFNLFLQIVDLDGAALDTSAAVAGSIAVGAEPYSYVEGMRQLAVGLNLLAQVIKKHRNVYVVVVSEGGRGAARTDDKVSHAMIMGPGGAGNMKDYLYANMAAVNSTSDVYLMDPNAGNGQMSGSGQRAPTDPVVANEAGTTIPEQMTVGAILNGLVRHIETKRSIQTTTTVGLGKFVRIQTG